MSHSTRQLQRQKTWECEANMKSLWPLSCRSQSICVNFASESSVINWFHGLQLISGSASGRLLFHMNQCTDHWTHKALTWRSKWKLYWDEPHPPRPPCHKRLQRSRRRGVKLWMHWFKHQTWHGHDQSGRTRGCEFLASARYRELEERHWVVDLLVEITDGPLVFFLCHFSCASERFKQMAMIFCSQERIQIWENL